MSSLNNHPSRLNKISTFSAKKCETVSYVTVIYTTVIELLLQYRNNHTQKEGWVSDIQEYTVIETHVTINCHTYLQVNVIVS